MTDCIPILIAEDQRLVAEALKTMIETHDPGLRVIGIAANGQEACRLFGLLSPAVTLMDLRMPEMDGIAAIRSIRTANPAATIIALTTFEEDDLVRNALLAGAIGYLLKDIGTVELVGAIRAAARGESPVSPKVARQLIQFALQPGAGPRGGAPAESSGDCCLTPRECEVLVLAARGFSTQEMADRLGLSRGTVKNHLSHIYDTLGIANRAEAATSAMRLGLLGPGQGSDAWNA
jgi:DNA-binding NarL/FixJ family response regulator